MDVFVAGCGWVLSDKALYVVLNYPRSKPPPLSCSDPSVVMEAAKALEYITLGSGGIMDELEAETARALVKVLYSRGRERRSSVEFNTKAAAAAAFGAGNQIAKTPHYSTA